MPPAKFAVVPKPELYAAIGGPWPLDVYAWLGYDCAPVFQFHPHGKEFDTPLLCHPVQPWKPQGDAAGRRVRAAWPIFDLGYTGLRLCLNLTPQHIAITRYSTDMPRTTPFHPAYFPVYIVRSAGPPRCMDEKRQGQFL